MDFPVPRFPPLGVISPFHPESLGGNMSKQVPIYLTGIASAAIVQDQIYYYPFRLHEVATVRKMSYAVGATSSGNVDIGIYDAQKNLIVSSGSTAQGTINVIQEVEITDTVLQPGKYFMAITFSSATATCFAIGGAVADEFLIVVPCYQEVPGAFGLPATANFAMSTTSPLVIGVGVHFDTLI